MITIEDIYGMIRDAVKFYPEQSRGALRPESFRVLSKSYARELEAANFGVIAQDKNLPFFYSRKWDKAGRNINRIERDYPLVTAFERPGRTLNPYTKPITVKSIELSVLDMFKAENADKTPNETDDGRPIVLVIKDCETILFGILAYIEACVICKPSCDTVERIYHKKQLEYMASIGQISPDYIAQRLPLEKGAGFLEAQTFLAEVPALSLYGSGIVIDIPVSRCISDVVFDFSESQTLSGRIPEPCQNCH